MYIFTKINLISFKISTNDDNEEAYLEKLNFLNSYDEVEFPWSFLFYCGKYFHGKKTLDFNLQKYLEASLGF